MAESGNPTLRRRTVVQARFAVVAAISLPSLGCLNAMRQGWLDPTALGEFERTATLDIRSSLTLEDMPRGVPGAEYPRPVDHVLFAEDHAISSGDSLAIEIYELRERTVPYQAQLQVSGTGAINLPVIGRIQAAGRSVPELEQTLIDRLREDEILVNPQVTVVPLFLQDATYSIFGVGVSAADNAPLRAGTFPIRRPDLRVLEAINQVGGLNEFVTEVFIFRSFVPPSERTKPESHRPPGSAPEESGETGSRGDGHIDGGPDSAEPLPDAEVPLAGNPEANDARDELLLAVDETAEKVAALPPGQEKPREIPPLLEPDASDPFIWVDDKFVPNPRYRERPADEGGASGATSFEDVVPAVNWARIAGDSTHRVLVIPADLLRTGDPDGNIFVRPGDVIRIVSGEIGVYYVMGQVNRVGAFAFNAEPVTLKAAIAAAGGLAPLAWPDRCTVYRRIGQREQMLQVNLDRIFAGQDPDFLIHRNDIINIGTHPLAPFVQSLRGLTIPNPVSNVGYSFTYARNFADIDSFAVQQNPQNQPSQFPQLFP
jgi:protein involved in polysaccharide export with SLBB domain